MRYIIWLSIILFAPIMQCGATEMGIEYGKDISLTADPVFHTEISEIIQQMATSLLPKHAKPGSEEAKRWESQLHQILAPVERRAQEDRTSTIRQIIWYGMKHRRDPAPNGFDSIPLTLGALFLVPLGVDFEECEISEIMWPCYTLLNPEDKALFMRVVGSLPSRIAECTEGSVNETGKAPSGAVDWMFDANANGACDAITGLVQTPEGEEEAMRQQFLPAARLWESRNSKRAPSLADLAEARKAARSLTTSEKWWLRMYAAQLFVDIRALAEKEDVERLKQDPEPLIRSRAARVPLQAKTP